MIPERADAGTRRPHFHGNQDKGNNNLKIIRSAPNALSLLFLNTLLHFPPVSAVSERYGGRATGGDEPVVGLTDSRAKPSRTTKTARRRSRYKHSSTLSLNFSRTRNRSERSPCSILEGSIMHARKHCCEIQPAYPEPEKPRRTVVFWNRTRSTGIVVHDPRVSLHGEAHNNY